MPLKVEAYLDSRGKLHQTLDAATIADLAHEVFGSAESMAPSLAQKLIDARVVDYDADASCSVHGVKVSDPDYSVWFRRGDIIAKDA